MPRTASNHVKQDDTVSSTLVSQPRGRYQPHSKFMDLPVDVTFNVFDHLEGACDSIALSLACRGLFDALFAKARVRFESADSRGKLNIQLMLEESAPPHCVYCHFCRVIHTVDKEYRRTSCLESKNFVVSSFLKHFVGSGTWSLDLLDARHRLNAVRFNRPDADKLLKPLGLKIETRSGTSQWMHKVEAKTKRPLILRSNYDAWAGDNADVWLETTSRHVHNGHQPFEEFTYSVCKHVHIHAAYPYIYADSRNIRPGSFIREWPTIRSTCTQCNAQWQITMEWIPQLPSVGEGRVLKIWSYHCLSNLRYRFRSEWSYCAGEYKTPDVKEMMKRHKGHWCVIYQDSSWIPSCPTQFPFLVYPPPYGIFPHFGIGGFVTNY